ncbi:hypothetical protein RRG08_037568 [Elysia crispata]|uniref:Uncharacterized protein n=1 Tax=Elysia crispata TaxID=231223 RepID=A0AAE1CTD9_9GAST|nr:hypothetical protein RRG08_037568 [Elysia crispata]
MVRRVKCHHVKALTWYAGPPPGAEMSSGSATFAKRQTTVMDDEPRQHCRSGPCPRRTRQVRLSHATFNKRVKSRPAACNIQ